MKRWLAVILLMFGGLGAEAVQPGPCQLVVNTRTGRYPDDRGGPGKRNNRNNRAGRTMRDDLDTGDDPKSERRRRIF